MPCSLRAIKSRIPSHRCGCRPPTPRHSPITARPSPSLPRLPTSTPVQPSKPSRKTCLITRVRWNSAHSFLKCRHRATSRANRRKDHPNWCKMAPQIHKIRALTGVLARWRTILMKMCAVATRCWTHRSISARRCAIKRRFRAVVTTAASIIRRASMTWLIHALK